MFNETDQGPVQYSNRRRFPRFDVNRPVTAILYWDGSPPVLIPGRCHSLSEGGLGATMSQQLHVGEVVNLEVAHGVRVYAMVRNLRGFAHGFEFVLVRDNQRAAIQRLCRARMS
jgi:PilZ domain